MRLFDSHCHLDDRIFAKDFDDVLGRFKTAGGEGIMIAGIDEKTCQRAVSLATAHEMCFASVGVHPHHAAQCTQTSLSALIKLAAHPKVRAWGEIGLDYNRKYSPMADQEKWFIKQLEAAKTADLPVIFHERDTQGRFLTLLKHHVPSGLKGVIHCFSGNQRELEAYLELGLCIGVTGIVTMQKRGADLRKLVPIIPFDRLLAETDAPWLTPAPERNHHKRNEPSFVRSVVLKLAAVRKQAPEALAEKIYNNTCRLFGIYPL